MMNRERPADHGPHAARDHQRGFTTRRMIEHPTAPPRPQRRGARRNPHDAPCPVVHRTDQHPVRIQEWQIRTETDPHSTGCPSRDPGRSARTALWSLVLAVPGASNPSPTSLSIGMPKASVICCAIRGHSHSDSAVSSTTAAMTSWLGPLGPTSSADSTRESAILPLNSGDAGATAWTSDCEDDSRDDNQTGG